MTGGASANLDGRRVGEAVGASILAGLGGNYAVTVARFLLSMVKPDWVDEERRVIEASLIVVLVATALCVTVAAHAIRRRWVHGETFVVAALVGVVAAFFAVIDLSVSVGPGQPLYFFGWIIGLWFLPGLILPNPDGTLGGRIGRAFGLLAVTAPMTVIGLVTGFIMERGVNAFGKWMLPSQGLYWDAVDRFWIAKPIGINAVGCAVVAVACANMWWPGLRWSRGRAGMWTVAVTAAAAVYAGLWGPYLYGQSEARWWVEFVGFGVLPVVGVVAVCLAYAATRRVGDVAVGWAVSKHFWWLLPTALMCAFALNAAFGLARIEKDVGMRLVVLIVAHGFNGAAIGGSLAATVCVLRLIPDSVKGSSAQV